MKGRLFGRLPDHQVVLLSQVAAMLMAVLGFVFTLSPLEPDRTARLVLAFAFLLLAVVFMLASVEQQKRSGYSRQRTDDRTIAGFASTDIQLASIRQKLASIDDALLRPEQVKRETDKAQRDELAKADEDRGGKIYLAAPTFTPESLETLRSQLANAYGRVDIMALMEDSDSLGDARQLAQAFRSANWKVTGVDRVGGFSVKPKGIYILARSPDSGPADFVQSALSAVGVQTKGSIAPTMAEDEIAIIVGETDW